MIKLVDLEEEGLYRGCVIKFIDTLDEDNTTCVMLCEIAGKDAYQLIRIDGYKAGIPVRTFNEEGVKGCSLSVEWLIENYKKWTYIDCGIENIYILSEPDINLFNY